ncbi:mitochondrial carrier domain-containing protein [Pilaira anomala]|nr:mitochondrial carrier domain-containing protein [Pilaira anomala]
MLKTKASNIRLQLEDLTFGSIGGMVGKVVEYPFDTIKVRLQTQSVENPIFKGPMDCLKSTIKEEGIKGLFKGMSSPIVGAMLENAVLFFGYRQIQREIRAYSAPNIETTPNTIIEKEVVPLTLNQLVLAGAIAGSMVSFILTPVELIKCKLQVQSMNKTTSFQGPMDIIKFIFRLQGLRGFYRGFIPTLVRETAGGAFWFGAYEYTSAGLIQYRQQKQKSSTISSSLKIISKNDLSAPELMLAGAIGGVAYNLSIFPIDAIKSRMQIENNGQKFKTFSHIAKEIYQGAGIKGFYRGCGMTAAKSAPANAIIFMTYVSINNIFREKKKGNTMYIYLIDIS